MNRSTAVLLVASFLPFLFGCRGTAPPPPKEVVCYTSVDQPHAAPILRLFESRTGIRMRAVYDVEASKTTGLVNRLKAEAGRPMADVYWSSEIVQTMWLKKHGVLGKYVSPNAEDIPLSLKDPDGCWAGLGLRGRVILVNSERVREVEMPVSIFDFLDPRWKPEDVGIALPLFGTTFTHATVLYSTLGEENAKDFFQAVRDKGIQVLDGNSTVRDRVSTGMLKMGLTDTDDARSAKKKGAPVRLIFPDRLETGGLYIPGTVALVRNAPHPVEARLLIDFLLSWEVEVYLMEADYFHASVRSPPPSTPISWAEIAERTPQVREDMREIFLH